ncbi:hypothetical protein [Kitasatospora sp. NPDC101183]|uniref:hypothetical protein n=1 Tax=Kitasatospora sp. NPDC101183 TaxID=3364100 RepID=UPI0037F94EDF
MPQNHEYQVTVKLDTQTRNTLATQGYALYGFKAVKTGATLGRPTVWFSWKNLLEENVVGWDPLYNAYISVASQKEGEAPAGLIDASTKRPIKIGQTMVVDKTGGVSVTAEGTPNCISVDNNSTTLYNTGLSQVNPNDGSATPLAAFPLHGDMTVTMEPLQQIILLFASATATQVSTVVEKAIGHGVFIDATENKKIEIPYVIDKGWDTGGKIYIEKIEKNQNIVGKLLKG